MSEKEIKELRDIKKLLVAQLLVSGVQAIEIAEILSMTKGNFSTEYKARKLIKRLKQNKNVNKKKVNESER